MDRRLITLKLVLEELGVAPDIKRLDDRKRIQKAVYLGQRAGLDLGYRFGWYLMGPYSPRLTRDYFALSEAMGSGDTDYEHFHLRGPARKALRAAGLLMPKPSKFPLSQEDWLELLASLDYQMRVRSLDAGEAIEALKEKKPRLHPYASIARRALETVPLPN